MLKSILRLLPTPILRNLADNSFDCLMQRSEIETWIVFDKKQSSIDEGLIPGGCYYLGMQIRIFCCSAKEWEWFVYDGYGEDVVINGFAESEDEAIEAAQDWVDLFEKDENIASVTYK